MPEASVADLQSALAREGLRERAEMEGKEREIAEERRLSAKLAEQLRDARREVRASPP